MMVDGQAVQLQCAEHELIDLAMAFANTSSVTNRNEQRIQSVVYCSAELTIYALHEFFVEFGSPPEDGAILTRWFQTFVEARFLGDSLARTSGAVLSDDDELQYKKGRRLLARMPQSNACFRKGLYRVVRGLTRLSKRSAKNWVDRIVGDQFIPPELTCPVDGFQELFVVSKHYRYSECDFELRLQTEKLNSMKQLAYGASHEINNPLANIASRAQALLLDASNPERRRKLAIIYEQAMRAHEMISDMMLFAHPPEPHFEWTNLGALADQVLKEMRSDLRRRGVTAVLRCYPAVDLVEVDATQIAVALKAMLRNSIESIEAKACDDSGRIIVRVWPDSDQKVALAVADNGVGVSENAKPHLFDPFYSSREAGRGLGFGLSKAWRISSLHHGELEWDQSYQGGTQFVLRLPKQQKLPSTRIDNVDAA